MAVKLLEGMLVCISIQPRVIHPRIYCAWKRRNSNTIHRERERNHH